MPAPLSFHARVASSLLSSTLAGGRGAIVVHEAVQPPLPLTLYEFEACPYCRLAREAFSALHLDVEIRPCPKGGARFRPEAIRLSGKSMFPYLVDPNTGTAMLESQDIVDYLFRTYANRATPSAYRPSFVGRGLEAVASGLRMPRGLRARPSKEPREPLHLWSFDASPYSRLVRERMAELELPYTLHNLAKEHWRELGPATRRITPNPYVPKEGGKRHAFFRAHGRVQVPYLEDPNTGAALFESWKILDYLESTYAL